MRARPRILPFRAPVVADVPVEVQRFDARHFNITAGLHAHQFLELLVVERGHGAHLHEGRRTPLRRGDVVTLAPGQFHDCADLASVEGWVVLFEPAALSAPGSLVGRATDPRWTPFRTPGCIGALHLSGHDRLELERHLSGLATELDAPGPGHRMAVAARLDLLLLLLAAQAAGQRAGVQAVADPLVREAMEVIERESTGSLSLAVLARRLGRSPSHLTERVRVATGRTVQQWIIAHRLDAARRLLVQTDEPVAAVAEAVGYVDPSHFTRHFTRANGLSPGAWRRAARAPADLP